MYLDKILGLGVAVAEQAAATGDAATQEGKAMLSELSAQCSMLKVIGHYASDVILQKGEKTHE